MSEQAAPPLPQLPLRVRRSWHWVRVPGVEMRLGGGPAPMQLEAVDVLEAQVNGEWVSVPVFEMPKPEHPGVAAERARAERQRAGLADVFKNIEEMFPAGSLAKARKGG